jgi:effector-binding domain-containing protein
VAAAIMEPEVRSMRYDIGIDERAPEPVIAIRDHTDMAGIAATMGRAFGELYGYLGQVGAPPAGPPVAIYGRMDPERGVDVEICVPVARPLAPAGRIEADTLIGGRVAVTRHRGPYDGLGAAYEATQGWIREHGLRPTGPPRERYLNGPDETPPEELETQIEIPVA